MKLQFKNVALVLICTGSFFCVQAAQVDLVDLPHEQDGTRSIDKNYLNLAVIQSLTVGGNALVGGVVTANNFLTSNGSLPVPGPLNYAVLSNQAAVDTATNILWAATPDGNLSAGITFDNTTGLITLPTSGTFLVRYTVRFDNSPFSGASSATAQLQQTNAGTPANIVQGAITTDFVLDGLTETIPDNQFQTNGYAIIAVTSAANNQLNLLITYDGNFELPSATGTDANAQMAIIQLN